MPEPARPAFARAWEELVASERVAAERPEAHVNIAGLLAQRGDAIGAVTAWLAALALDSAHLPALVNMAAFERRRGRHAEALAALDRVVAAHPVDAAAHHARGLALVRTGNARSALPALARAAELAPDAPRYGYVRAIALNSLGQRAEARQALRDVVARHPRDRDSLLALVTLERDLGNRAEASRLAAALVALDPGDREAAALHSELSRP
jgi:tetratricopeptide (TPR) repeat protein